MKNRILYLIILTLIIVVSCSKDNEKSVEEIQKEKENLLCKKWERTYLTIDSDTNYAENWIFSRAFFKDKTYILHITRLGDPGEEDEYDVDTSAWRWSGDNFDAIEVNTWYDEDKWFYSRVPKLTETELILEQDRDNNELFRFHFKSE